MIALMVEAAFRSMVLAVAVWVVLSALRLRPSVVRRWRLTPANPQVERLAWTMVLLGALGMPLVVQWGPPTLPLVKQWGLPTLPLAAFTLPDMTLDGLQGHGHQSSWYVGLLTVYVGVALLLFARLAIGFALLWRVRWGAIPINESWTEGADVRVTSRIPSPLTFGSTILLPTSYVSWGASKRSVIMAHEMSHARHGDCYVQWLAALHESLFWFSPLAWWLRQHLGDLAEQASDDAVLRANTDRADYAALLLEAAKERAASNVGMSMGRGRVTKRIERILSIESPARIASGFQRAAAITLVLPAIALAAYAQHVQAQLPQEARAYDRADAQAQREAPPRTAMTPSTDKPYILSTADAGPLTKWYPKAAQRTGMEGNVQLTVTLDEAGRATDTLILSEYPDGMGFGAAASALAHAFTYANPTGHRASLTFRVKFALNNEEKPETTTFDSDASTDL